MLTEVKLKATLSAQHIHRQHCEIQLARLCLLLYALIKTPFDLAKVYIFDNNFVKNLALNPGYI
jgi:hypothetical protein